MKHHIQVLALSLFATLLAGCTTASVPTQAKSQIRRIAIVSLFPSEIDIHQIGIFPVLHDSKVAQIREWDAHTVTLSITERLLRERGYDTVQLDAREFLLALPTLPEPQQVMARLLPAAHEKKADAVVFVAPYRMTSNGPDFHSVYFAPSKLFGVKSVFGGCVSSAYVFSDSGALLARSIDNGSFKDMRGISWRDSWADYSETERQAIYAQLEKLIEENLRWKLSKVL